MNNPWMNLPAFGNGPYILPEDRCHIDNFNKNCKAEHKIVTNLTPEPWLGPVKTARLVVLQLNPRYDEEAKGEPNKEKHLGLSTLDGPHWGLSSGKGWWTTCFNRIAIAIGDKLFHEFSRDERRTAAYKFLQTRVCSIEYFPYGSKNFAHEKVNVPSREYSIALVKEALERRPYIVVLKGYSLWLKAVPGLKNHHERLKNVGERYIGYGARHITQFGCGDEFFNAIVDCLVQTNAPCS